MKKLILLLLVVFSLAFTPKLNVEDLDFAVDLYLEHGDIITPKILQGDTIYYEKLDTIYLLRTDMNYLPWVIGKKKAEHFN